MECPKCHTIINDNDTVCPKCNKVLLLECPNCHSLEDTAICSKCGYKILIKCSKCGRINPSINDLCVKCGFPTKSSLAFQECESDEIAYVTVSFNNLKKIRRLLKSGELYEKFFFKLKNLLLAQVRNTEGLFITYGETFVLNFNKELSFPTSANKAVRFALKLVNTFTQLNLNVLEELRVPLGLNVTIAKKSAENLQEIYTYENNVKLLNVKKDLKKYLKGTQIILDQYVWDEVNREYKTDSLYSMEENGKTTMFYEIVLDSYILPPDNEKDNSTINASIQKITKISETEEPDDIYSFKVFDINAKCKFETTTAVSIKEKLDSLDFEKSGKILALRSKVEYSADMFDIVEACEAKGYKTLTVTCSDEMNYKPWGVFIQLFKTYYNMSFLNTNNTDNINPQHFQTFKSLFDLCNGIELNTSSPEDARYAYMELWDKFLSILSKTVIIIDGFDKIDNTSLQTLELYFDNFKNITPNFIFTTSEDNAIHSKIKKLLRTDRYTEFKLVKSSFAKCLSTIKIDASDFIGSFYFGKIQENFNGSYLYFRYAIKYLMETSVLICFENKLLVKSSKSVVLPPDLNGIYKARMKYLGKNPDISFIIAYLTLLCPCLDLDTITRLGIKDIRANVKTLIDSTLTRMEGNNLLLNNYTVFHEVITNSLKKEAEAMLAKNVLGTIGACLDKTSCALIMGKLDSYSDEYEFLCENANFALAVGDYDAYLKNCLGFLSLIESVELNITPDKIEDQKKEVYNSILKHLYNYAPNKIYFIENILLSDSINENNTDKIIKLSNLMLQGALISSNYSDARKLLHNIFSRMEKPTLVADGVVNTKFLLLSLVNIEILYNTGKFRECVETAKEVLSVIKIESVDKIKPAGFSTASFITHILETMRFAAFAKLYMADDGLDNFLDLISITLNADLPEKDCILAIRDFLSGKVYNTGVIEAYTPFSKIIFLILQEIANLQVKGDYKKFAQNIFQAKLLAEDIFQLEIKYFCDLMIAYAYSQIGITTKAEFIYNDVLASAKKSAMFNIQLITQYLLIKLEKDSEKAILMTNDALDYIRKYDNQAAVLYVLFEKLYIDIVRENEFSAVNIEAEEQKISAYTENLKIITG